MARPYFLFSWEVFVAESWVEKRFNDDEAV
jgi:hypothetical protein